MDLIEILDRTLRTKNEIRDILGETNNISRYPIAIHNYLAIKYNEGYIKGYYDRYLELNDEEIWIPGPIEIYEYGIDATHYEEYTTEVLTDIMRDVLNYRLNMKDELEIDSDEFVTYPDYLRGKIEGIYDIGYSAGKDQADEDYEGSEDVHDPVITNNHNKVTITSDQLNARLKFKIGEDGIEYEYSRPIIISESCTIYAKAIIGRSPTDWVQLACAYDPDGYISFVTPPTIQQQDSLIYLSSSMNNCTIEYKIDRGEYIIYTHAISTSISDSIIYARCIRNGEYSQTIAQPISHASSLTRPANVTCNITDTGTVRYITFNCVTQGAEIRYAINNNTGDFFLYHNEPVEETSDHFTVYAFSIKNGEESPNRLYWKFDKNEVRGPQPVDFQDSGTNCILSTSTTGAYIKYRYGTVGTYIASSSNQVILTPPDGTTIYAFAVLGGKNSDETSHTFYKNSGSQIAEPFAWLDENNMINVNSVFQVLYSVDASDPRIGGINYSGPIRINTTTTFRCVAKNGSQFSNIKTYTFTPSTENGVNTGEWNNQGEGWENKDWFWVFGCDRISWTGDSLYYYDGSSFKSFSSSAVLDPNKRTYFYGVNVSKFTTLTGTPNIGGNILSLKVGKNFDEEMVESFSPKFNGMFANSTVMNAGGLRLKIKNVGSSQFESLFENCNNLVVGPDLPATDIGTRGYAKMFKGCANLVAAPELPAEKISSYCYSEMFSGTALTSPPQLPATVLNEGCYQSMFENCSSLLTAPILPSTNMVRYCYYKMFKNCVNIRTAPELPAEQLSGVTGCYEEMFYGCGKLNYIKAMFINRPTGNFSAKWVYGVAETGTFIKNTAAEWTDRGVNAVPENWTVSKESPAGKITAITYNPNTGKCKITASNADPIWYSLDTATYNIEYKGEFQMMKDGYVFARCVNKNGQAGPPFSKYIVVSYPPLVATIYSRKISITSAGFEYDRVEYGFMDEETGTPTIWYQYTYGDTFTHDTNTWIWMKGYIAGKPNPVREDKQYLISELTAPVFNYVGKNANGSKDIYKITYPDPDKTLNPIIYWSENNPNNYNNSGQSEYTIEVNWYEDEMEKVYYAKAQVTYKGNRVFSSIASLPLYKNVDGTSVILSKPNIWQHEGDGNMWYLEYEGVQYTEWDDPTIIIYYYVADGGVEPTNSSPKTKVYKNGINLREITPLPITSKNVDIWVWASTANVNNSEKFHEQRWLDLSQGSTQPDKPTIIITQKADRYYPYTLRLDNPTTLAMLGPYDDMYNQYYFEPVDTIRDPEAVYYNLQLRKWTTLDRQNGGGTVDIPYWITSAKIKARTVIIYDAINGEPNYSEENTEQYWDDEIWHSTITSIDMNQPYAHIEWDEDNQEYRLFIDVDANVDISGIHRFFTVEDPKWTKNYSPVIPFENVYCDKTGFPFHDYSGSSQGVFQGFYGGTFKCWWVYYVDETPITGSSEPYIIKDWRDNRGPVGMKPVEPKVTSGKNLLLTINNPNTGYRTWWHIKDAVFAGGATNTTKYNELRLWTWNYGFTLDEFIISGTVEAWSEDDEHVGKDNLNDELKGTWDFSCGTYSSISAPTVEFVDNGGYYPEIFMTNTNKYVTNVYRKDNESTYHTCSKYGTSLVTSQNCYCYCYSWWGDQVSPTVVKYYDNGVFTSYAPPTITPPILNPDGITYTLNITNNSTLPKLYWKIDPTQWNVEDKNYSQFNKYINNQKAGFWRQESLPYNSTYSIRLDSSLISGFIQAKASDSINWIFRDNVDNTTPTSTYNFVNRNYTE